LHWHHNWGLVNYAEEEQRKKDNATSEFSLPNSVLTFLLAADARDDPQGERHFQLPMG
jgi:hypothetical protein